MKFPSIRDWTILVVDDQPENVRLIQKFLTHYGVEVHTASNGVSGLEILQHITPTVILLDLSMPDMDGWEMLRYVREDPATNHIPVIAVTGHVTATDREKMRAAGFNGSICKPLSVSTFLTEVWNYVYEPSKSES